MTFLHPQQMPQRWSKDKSYCIGAEADGWGSMNEVEMLDRQTYSSVEDAVTALNCESIGCSEFCVVFSKRRQAYYLLWPSEKTQADVAELAVRAKDRKTTSGYSSVASTTDTTPHMQDREASPFKSALPGRVLVKPQAFEDAVLAAARSAVSASASKFSTVKGVAQPEAAVVIQGRAASPKRDASPLRARAVPTPQAPRATSQEPQPVPALTRKPSAKGLTPSQVASSAAPIQSGASAAEAKDSNGLRKARLLSPRRVASPFGRQARTLEQATPLAPSTILEQSQLPTAPKSVQLSAAAARVTAQPAAPISPSKSLTASPAQLLEQDDGGSPKRGMMAVSMADVSDLTIEELRMDIPAFNPMHPPLRSQLLTRLGFGADATLEPSMDNSGAFNDGVWQLYDRNYHGLVLKLVDCTRRHPSRRTDTEKFIEIKKRCPKIVTEFSLAYPVVIFQLRNPNGSRTKDLIVMRRAAGMQLTRVIYDKFHGNDLAALNQVFRELGAFIATIHRVYKDQNHGDCQPSNVFYDHLTNSFTLIDVADFGYGPFVTEWGHDDVESFARGLQTLSQWYGARTIADAERHFREGYRSSAQGRN